MLPVSLADLSISQALELLAFRKQAVDAGLVARVPRELLAESDVFRRVGERIQEKNAAQKRAFNPDIGQALALAGSGGLIGGVSSLASAPKGQRSLRRVLEGAISGAAMGGGLSALDQAAGTNLGRHVQDAGRAALNRVQATSPSPVASAIGAARGGLANARQAISSAVSPLTAEPDLTGGVTDETLGNLEAGSSAARRLPFYRPAMLAGHLLAGLVLAVVLRTGEARIFAAARRRYLQWQIAVRSAVAGLGAPHLPRPRVITGAAPVLTSWLHCDVQGRGPPAAAFC